MINCKRSGQWLDQDQTQKHSQIKVASAKSYGNSLMVCNQCYPLQLFGNKLELYYKDLLQSASKIDCRNSQTWNTKLYPILHIPYSSDHSPTEYFFLTFRFKNRQNQLTKILLHHSQFFILYQREINNFQIDVRVAQLCKTRILINFTISIPLFFKNKFLF